MSESEHYPVPSPNRYKLARKLFQPYLSKKRVSHDGSENLPSGNAPYILAANHRSLLDIPLLGGLLLDYDDSQVHFVAKKELWRIRPLGNYLSKGGAIAFDREQSVSKQPGVAESIQRVLQGNGVLGMFPEKTRKKGTQVQIDERGLGILAVANLVPIVPVGIAGTESLKGPIHVTIGEPVQTGVLGPENRRKRMVEMEEEYVEAMQSALDLAHLHLDQRQSH